MATTTDSHTGPRDPSDRRRTPTSPWAAFFPGGRRRKNRRTSEHARPYFVDQFSAATMGTIVLLLIMSIADAVITLILIEDGCEEINPVMDIFLRQGPLSFLMAKYVLTVAGLPVLLIFKNFYLFGSRFRVGYLIPIFILLYAILIGYQFTLLRN